jgi:hypothetical protein
MPHPHEDLIARFYDAFERRDPDGMAACYHADIYFQDEVFDLHGARAGAMWHMLCSRGKDLELEVSDIEADEESGSARWVAAYTFSQTKRAVRNDIRATFIFEDGLIRTHRDRFDFRAWSQQALGAAGTLLGWTPWLRQKVRAQAAKGLDVYIARHPDLLSRYA